MEQSKISKPEESEYRQKSRTRFRVKIPSVPNSKKKPFLEQIRKKEVPTYPAWSSLGLFLLNLEKFSTFFPYRREKLPRET